MADALIGYTGFVGSTLLRQRGFDELYRSTNIQDICERDFDVVVCAGAPAQKWIATQAPFEDRKKIDSLIECLDKITCRKIILISTVDVFKNPNYVDENSVVEEKGLHPYGLHRRILEKFVESRFDEFLIVRLPGLVGPELRKNAIYDLKHSNNLELIDSRGVYQFYPMVNLWYDIKISLENKLKLVHLTAEPISVAEIAREGFGFEFGNTLSNVSVANYNLQSIFGDLFGGSKLYQYSRRESLQSVRLYAQI